ncbi:hypothetical protein DFH09DRAFT_1463372 [Mycena vulgaris]|nr:hypothetical protein DFH09DRAFT_1463372 [Mycena vulgaris]
MSDPNSVASSSNNSATNTLHDPELNVIIPSKTHDDGAPDLSFPSQTTDTYEGGVTDEYRVSTKSGLMDARHALHPVLSRVAEAPHALADPEKAERLSKIQLHGRKCPRGSTVEMRGWFATVLSSVLFSMMSRELK